MGASKSVPYKPSNETLGRDLGYFLLFHTFQTHVSKREKPTLRIYLH